MVALPDAALGLLLGISAFLLALSLSAYMRSGVRGMLLLSEGLGVHIALTVALLVAAYVTDWLDTADGWILVLADVIVFASVVLLGFFGGRGCAGPS